MRNSRCALLLLGLCLLPFRASTQADHGLPPLPAPATPRGVVTHEPGVSPGYLLFGPIASASTYLVDNQGRVVHEWKGEYSGGGGYLLPDGHLLRGVRDPDALGFRQGGVQGILQRVSWEGEVVWEWRLSEPGRILHHDIEPLPNGHVLAMVWELTSKQESIALGRRPEAAPEAGLNFERVIEIAPRPPRGAEIVWEWRVRDHLVQDHDPALPHHGDPAEHPGRFDLNALTAPAISAEELAQLQALGYVPDDATPADLDADFLHANSIDYHAGLDQIAISVPQIGEVWILDHAPSTEEARGARGDLLYRWGNPAVYGRGADSPRQLFFQHDARWIPEGFPGAGKLLVFNNGRDRPEGPWSSVEEIAPPLGRDGRYALEAGRPYAPLRPGWSWRLPPERFAPFISGAERLANGNTLVCSGPDGVLLEVTPEGRIVWEFRNPFAGDLKLADGTPPQPGIDRLPFAVFRTARIPPGHPGLAGRRLAPLEPQPVASEPAPPPATP